MYVLMWKYEKKNNNNNKKKTKKLKIIPVTPSYLERCEMQQER